ncbi:MAG: lipocalin family protein [Succinivibrionaceae bacterium]|nr:lipocalin family protein [Succinivibrionaceae bacterium]
MKKNLKPKMMFVCALAAGAILACPGAGAVSYAPGHEPQAPAGLVHLAASMQDLQGAWMGSGNGHTMGLLFDGQTCGFIYDNMQKMGTFIVNGNQLNMSFQDGSSVNFTISLSGNTLVLDGNVTLTRTQLPQGGGQGQSGGWGNNGGGQGQSGGWGNNGQDQNGGWGGNGQGQQDGGWGSPQGGGWGSNGQGQGQGQNGGWGNNGSGQGQSGGWGNNGQDQNGGWGNGQQQASGQQLQGAWFAQGQDQATGQFVQMVIVFTDNMYNMYRNGQQLEIGEYRYDPSSGRFDFRVVQGQSRGMQGTNMIRVQGNQMMISFMNGGQMMFTRQN